MSGFNGNSRPKSSEYAFASAESLPTEKSGVNTSIVGWDHDGLIALVNHYFYVNSESFLLCRDSKLVRWRRLPFRSNMSKLATVAILLEMDYEVDKARCFKEVRRDAMDMCRSAWVDGRRAGVWRVGQQSRVC